MKVLRAAICATAAALPTLTIAQTNDAVADNNDWRYAITPYIWATSMSGTTSIGALTGQIDLSFSEILEQLEGALFLDAAVRYDRWAIFADLLYADLQSDVQVGPGTLSTNLKMTMAGLSVGYRFGPWEGDKLRTVIEPYAGFRYTDFEVNITPPLGAAAQRGMDFVDPIVGARVSMKIRENMDAAIIADIGGFGVGSELTWQVAAVVGWAVGKRKQNRIWAGYKALGIDANNGSTPLVSLDTTMHGPVFGFSFRF